MQLEDLSTQAYVAIVDRAERAISGGASPKYAMKFLCDSGVHEDIAKKAVLEAVDRRNSKRVAEEERYLQEKREKYKVAYISIAIGGALFGISFLLPSGLQFIAIGGLFFVAFGFRMLFRFYRHSNY